MIEIPFIPKFIQKGQVKMRKSICFIVAGGPKRINANVILLQRRYLSCQMAIANWQMAGLSANRH